MTNKPIPGGGFTDPVPGGTLAVGQIAELLGKLEPAMVKFQPKIVGPKDPELLKQWETLVTTRFGLSPRNAETVSKTIDSCPGGGLDMTDTD